MKFQVFQNKKDKLWQWRVVNQEGDEFARSRKAWGHRGNCLSEIIRVSQIDLGPDLKNVEMPRK